MMHLYAFHQDMNMRFAIILCALILCAWTETPDLFANDGESSDDCKVDLIKKLDNITRGTGTWVSIHRENPTAKKSSRYLYNNNEGT